MNHEIDEKESLITELSERITNGVFKENPTFVLLLGMCPTLAVTTSGINGLGMGVTTMMVLAMSNLFISLLRKAIPSKIRIPAFIVIIASFVTIVELLLNAYIPSLYKNLGIYIPLIVVNCIILGRAEAYAYSHGPLLSLFDGIGMGMGFTIALTIIGSVRELLGSGKVFNMSVMPQGYVPVSIFIMAPGAFFILAILTAIQNKVKEIGERNGKDMSKIQSGCGGNCLNCDKDCKVVLAAPSEEIEEETEEEIEESEEIKEETPEESVPVTEESETIETEAVKENETTEETEEVAETEEGETSQSVTDEVVETASDSEETVESVEEDTQKQTDTEEIKEPVATEEVASIEKVEEEPKEEPSEKPSEDVASKETEKVEKPSEEKVENTASDDNSDDDLELLDFSDYKKAIKKSAPAGKKPVRKRSSMEKAQAMLNKADTKKGEKND